MTVEIPLTRGLVALVDDGDYGLVSPYSWQARKGNRRSGFYAQHAPGSRRGPNQPARNVSMHRFILGISDPRVEVDHVNGNGLDNRRLNLRLCTHAQNSANSRKPATRNGQPLTSRYKGVCLVKGKWLAQITYQRRNHRLGAYAVEEDAARAYDAKARELFGSFARVNFDV